MSKKNQIKNKIWLVITEKYNFTIVAYNEKQCKELVDEISEGTITEKLYYHPIGNMCPTMKFYDNWEGESFVVSTNFYNVKL